jgi:hypothetical protein
MWFGPLARCGRDDDRGYSTVHGGAEAQPLCSFGPKFMSECNVIEPLEITAENARLALPANLP